MTQSAPFRVPRRSRLGRNLRRVGVIYCVLAVLIYFFADHLILFPSRHAIPTSGETRIETAGPKGTIEIWTLRSEACKGREPAAIVLHFVGNASRAESEGRYVVDQWRDCVDRMWGKLIETETKSK